MRYRVEVRTEAVRLLVQEGVSAREVGRRLGVSGGRVGCWARAAGLVMAVRGSGGGGLAKPAPRPRPPRVNGRVRSVAVKREALRLLVKERVSAREVGRQLRVSDTQVRRWASVAGVTLSKHNGGGVDEVPDQFGDRSKGNGNRLSAMDRAVIYCRHRDGVSNRQIAAELGVHHSTIGRELGRGCRDRERGYDPGLAQRRSVEQRARPKTRKLDTNPRLRASVVRMLNRAWSPQQVAQRLKFFPPAGHDGHVSHETIYQALYVQGKGALRDELKRDKALRSGRARRIPQSKLPPRPARPWLDGAHISTRPAQATDRAVPGHFEGDLVIGAGCKSALITLIDRCTRYVLIRRLPERHDAPTVADMLIDMVTDLPKDLRRSLTWDQGSEMARCADFTMATDCKVYFCDPHSPWQRPSNENLNGLVRDFYPKGTDFRRVSDADIAEMQDLLNDRPRNVLHWHTPTEKLTQLLTGGALTT